MRIIEIKGCKTCKKVLVFKERTDEGKDIGKLVAWHDINNESFYQEGKVLFHNNEELIDNFINDFSEFSANHFANQFNL